MNYESMLTKLRADIPGLATIPKAPDVYPHRRLVDIHTAKWQRHLAKRIPKIDPKRPHFPESQRQTPRGFLADLLSEGYLVVVEELNLLTEEEETLICKGKGVHARSQSFLANKLILDELVSGLKLCSSELKSDWSMIKVDYCSLHKIATILLHVLFVKKAKYWQEELPKHPKQQKIFCANFSNDLASALAYAEEVRQYETFVATTLRKGLFFEDLGEHKKAMEDYDTVFALIFNFGDKEALAMVMNRYGRENKRCKKVVPALDYFTQEWEIASQNNFPELKAESLQDLGHLLLEEGDLWQADECLSHSYSLFRETKRKDTPNELADLSWAMNGVSRGMHLWSRYSGLLRTGYQQDLRHILKWRCNRKPLPVVVHNPYRPHRTFRYDQQYTFSGDNRRFFEFKRELGSRLSDIVTEEDMIELFAFINNTRVPREFTKHKDSEDDDYMALSVQRSMAAKMKAESMAYSLRRTIQQVPLMADELMTEDLKHNYRRSTWKRSHKHLHKLSIFRDKTVPLEIKLKVLLRTMDEFATDSDVFDEGPSFQFQLTPKNRLSVPEFKLKTQSKMPSDLVEEFRNFNASEWKL
ncbi:unnamed protein product [Orchesella dallaii]|uniref:Uncharacterized protein n=1 Tax=Orchesella dallaii TaxID=48710 RepID=A0ABP1PRV8_9HEXA